MIRDLYEGIYKLIVSTDHSLFINCGGSEEIFENNRYEADSTGHGPSSFISESQKWAYSSIGVYLGNNDNAQFIATNSFNVIDGEIYKTASLAPQSLKYYGLCMMQGSYKVRLHFAEIMYTNDQTFSSLGRRIFDVSIQVS